MAFSANKFISSWHHIRLLAHGSWPRGAGPAPVAQRSVPGSGSGPGLEPHLEAEVENIDCKIEHVTIADVTLSLAILQLLVGT